MTGSEPSLTVLVVDDEPVSRLVLANMLHRLGHRVLQAASVAEATGIAAGNAPGIDLVLGDYCLPDGTGRGLLGRLRSAGLHCPGVLVAGVARFAPETPGTEANGPGDGADAWLVKPVDSRALAACLDGQAAPA